MEDRKNSAILLLESLLHCGQWKSLVRSVWGGKAKAMDYTWVLRGSTARREGETTTRLGRGNGGRGGDRPVQEWPRGWG